MTKLTDERLANICRAPWQDLDDVTNDEIASMSDELKTARAEIAALTREADRLRHGAPIEGDFVCPDSLALSDARAQLAKMGPVYEQVLAFRANWPETSRSVLPFELVQAIDAATSPAVNGGDDE